MKTNQLMQRDFEGNMVTQRTDNSYLSATDLLRIYNEQNPNKQKVIAEFFSNKGTQEFMNALSNDVSVNIGNSLYLKNELFTSTRGKKGSTYMHPYLFVKFAMWLSPTFEVKVIKWVYDNLIKVRNDAGTHYTQMCDAIQERWMEWSNGEKPDQLVFIREADFIRELAFGYKDKTRNEATEKELRLLDALQLANTQLIKQGANKDVRKSKLIEFAKLYN